MIRNSALNICKESIQLGEKANLALQMPDFYSCVPLYMPIKVIHSKNPGPCLLIIATLNGNEMNGLEIVNRLINSLEAHEIAGTILAVPVVNVYGLTHHPKSMPSGEKLVDCFPGQWDGKYGERIAHVLTTELIQKADYCLEIDTGSLNHCILPQVYCHFKNKKAKELAKVFQVPVITNLSPKANKLHQTLENLNITHIIYQAGEAMRFDEHAIRVGIEGIKNIMRSIDILPKEQPIEHIQPVFSQDEDWITAHKGGILHVKVELGQMIKKGEFLGFISDPFSSELAEAVRATQDGIIVGINTTPLIHEGLSIFKIASFVDYDKAGDAIESWEEHQRSAIA